MECDRCKKKIVYINSIPIQTFPDHMTTKMARVLCEDCHKKISKMVEAWILGMKVKKIVKGV